MDKTYSPNLKQANQDLAEDRILCLEIFANQSYYLKYLPDAKAKTDSVISLIALMG